MENDAVFIDTAYIYALINRRDQWHETAVDWRLKIKANDHFRQAGFTALLLETE